MRESLQRVACSMPPGPTLGSRDPTRGIAKTTPPTSNKGLPVRSQPTSEWSRFDHSTQNLRSNSCEGAFAGPAVPNTSAHDKSIETADSRPVTSSSCCSQHQRTAIAEGTVCSHTNRKAIRRQASRQKHLAIGLDAISQTPRKESNCS